MLNNKFHFILNPFIERDLDCEMLIRVKKTK